MANAIDDLVRGFNILREQLRQRIGGDAEWLERLDPRQPPADTRSLEELQAELDSLVGLDSVKDQVSALVAFLQVQGQRLEHGKPIRFGAEDERGVRLLPDASAEIVEVADVGEEGLLVHDEHARTPSLAAAIARLSHTPHGPTPIGVFRDVERPVYDDLMAEQLATASAKQQGDLAALLQAGDTWTI